MAYMAAVMAAAPGAHGRHGTSGVPLLTGALLLHFTAYALWTGVRLIPVAAVAGGTRPTGSMGWGDRPEVARACRCRWASRCSPCCRLCDGASQDRSPCFGNFETVVCVTLLPAAMSPWAAPLIGFAP